MPSEFPAFEHIKYERDGDILFLIFNRPEKLNAVNRTLHNELVPSITWAEQDPDSKVIVFTGAGRGFCAGGDVAGQASSPTGTNSPRGPYDVGTKGESMMEVLLALEKPTIAMVNGPAVGLGASIALFADMAIAAEEAVIGDTHIRVGLVPGDGGAVIWPLLIGPPRAKEMLMTGRLLNGIEAERLGLVNYAVPADQLRARTVELAAEIARQPTYAVRATKFAINRHIRAALHNTMDVALALELISLASEEHREAALEFVRSRTSRR
jgi:enoyl-CoA hydratase